MHIRTSQAALVKNPPASAGDVRDVGSIPGWGRSPGEGNGNPLQYSCLENPLNRGAWWALVHRVTKSWTRLRRLSMHTHGCYFTLRPARATFLHPSPAHFLFTGPYPAPELYHGEKTN